jgi:hypothetical protein
MQTSGTIKKRYLGATGQNLGASYAKNAKRVKQKSSHTFGDLSTISTILSKFYDFSLIQTRVE